MNTILTKSNWKAGELDQKRIEFRMPLEEGPVEGLGTLWATQCPDDLLSISIAVNLRWADGSTTHIRVPLPQIAVDRIELHPDQSIAKYRLLA